MPRKQFAAMAASFARVAGTALAVSVGATWENSTSHDVLAWGKPQWVAFSFAVAGATVHTLINYVRSGETRFGNGADVPA